ncbi:MAG: bifunctional pyr operon transcriptional regulator/uracil phosphoribosyltransferase PyrR [bacterium]
MEKVLLDKKDIDRAITRMAHEIIERNKGIKNICLIGIQRGGVHLAERLAEKMAKFEGQKVAVGSLDIALYRDDIGMRDKQPVVRRTDVTCEINAKTIVLVDDVLFTGRSIRAALDALMDMGRPSMIQLAVLIDRGHRELPVRADYVGKNIPTSRDEIIAVDFEEEGAATDVVSLMKKEEE